MRKKIVAGLVIASVAALGFVLLRGFDTTTQKTAFRTDVLASNIRYPYFKDGNIRFFTGSTFAEIKPGEAVSRSLFKEVRFPQAESVQWGQNGALLHFTSPVSPLTSPELAALIPSDRQTNLTDYWIYASFETKEMTPIKLNGALNGIKDILLSNDSVYILNNEGSVYEQTINGPARQLASRLTAADLLTSIGRQTLVYLSGDGPLEELDIPTKKVKRISNEKEAVGSVKFDPANSRYLAYEVTETETRQTTADSHDNSGPGTLKVYDLVKNKQVYKQEGLKSDFFISGLGLLVYNTEGKPTLFVDDFEANRKTNYDISASKMPYNAMAATFSEGNGFIVIDQAGLLTRLVQDKNSPLLAAGGKLPLVDFGSLRLSFGKIQNNGPSAGVLISIQSIAPEEVIMSEPGALLSKRGFDPNQINKRWAADFIVGD